MGERKHWCGQRAQHLPPSLDLTKMLSPCSCLLKVTSFPASALLILPSTTPKPLLPSSAEGFLVLARNKDRSPNRFPPPKLWAWSPLCAGWRKMKMYLHRHLGRPSHGTVMGRREGKPTPLPYTALSRAEGCWQPDVKRWRVQDIHTPCPGTGDVH